MSTEKGSVARTKSRISGKEATYVALAANKYPPVKIGALDNSEQSSEATQTTPNGHLRSFPDSMPQIRGVPAMGEFLTRNSSLQIAFSRDSFGDQAVFAVPRPSGEALATPYFVRPLTYPIKYLSDLELPEQFRRCHRTVANRIQFFWTGPKSSRGCPCVPSQNT